MVIPKEWSTWAWFRNNNEEILGMEMRNQQGYNDPTTTESQDILNVVKIASNMKANDINIKTDYKAWWR